MNDESSIAGRRRRERLANKETPKARRARRRLIKRKLRKLRRIREQIASLRAMQPPNFERKAANWQKRAGRLRRELRQLGWKPRKARSTDPLEETEEQTIEETLPEAEPLEPDEQDIPEEELPEDDDGSEDGGNDASEGDTDAMDRLVAGVRADGAKVVQRIGNTLVVQTASNVSDGGEAIQSRIAAKLGMGVAVTVLAPRLLKVTLGSVAGFGGCQCQRHPNWIHGDGAEHPRVLQKLTAAARNLGQGIWRKPIALGTQGKLHTRPGQNAMVIPVEPGLFIVQFVPDGMVPATSPTTSGIGDETEIGVLPLLLLPGIAKAVRKGVQKIKDPGPGQLGHPSTPPLPKASIPATPPEAAIVPAEDEDGAGGPRGRRRRRRGAPMRPRPPREDEGEEEENDAEEPVDRPRRPVRPLRRRGGGR